MRYCTQTLEAWRRIADCVTAYYIDPKYLSMFLPHLAAPFSWPFQRGTIHVYYFTTDRQFWSYQRQGG